MITLKPRFSRALSAARESRGVQSLKEMKMVPQTEAKPRGYTSGNCIQDMLTEAQIKAFCGQLADGHDTPLVLAKIFALGHQHGQLRGMQWARQSILEKLETVTTDLRKAVG